MQKALYRKCDFTRKKYLIFTSRFSILHLMSLANVKNASSTFMEALADVSMNLIPYSMASSSPRSLDTYEKKIFFIQEIHRYKFHGKKNAWPRQMPEGPAWTPGGLNIVYLCLPGNHQSYNFLVNIFASHAKFK